MQLAMVRGAHAARAAATIRCDVHDTGAIALRLSELQYELPAGLIAQRPVEPRDASRLLVVHRDSGRLEHRVFGDIGEYLEPNDCLVLNDTSVVPARFFCRRATGGRVETLFLYAERDGWRVLLKPSARLRIGEHLECPGTTTVLRIDERFARGEWLVRPEPHIDALDFLTRVGQTPLPPYIRRTPETADVDCYQTVYARRPGAVAAPTAGLHFTDSLLVRLAGCSVRQARVTLHVGAGTFVPVQAEDLAQHEMHAEWYEITPSAAAVIEASRAAGGRTVAVGTTSVRVLESLPGGELGPIGGESEPRRGWTDLFIYPPHTFHYVDRLVTNFHLPGSTLLALVMAFATPALIRAAYEEAIAERYRFYSYGDAMLVL